MMVGVAHEMTSDFNQMVEYRIKNACVKNIQWNEDTDEERRKAAREKEKKGFYIQK